MDKLEKMKLRKEISDTVRPVLATGIRQPKIFMEIMEDKLRRVFDLFIDGYDFRKKLERKFREEIKQKNGH